MTDQFKYYSQKEYMMYGSILETAEEIDRRIAKHQKIKEDNKKLCEKYKDDFHKITKRFKNFK